MKQRFALLEGNLKTLRDGRVEAHLDKHLRSSLDLVRKRVDEVERSITTLLRSRDFAEVLALPESRNPETPRTSILIYRVYNIKVGSNRFIILL